MPLIPEHIVDQVRDSVDIVDVISEYVVLTKRGRNFLGLCPFHDDRRPSFNVSQEKQIYKCFSCGAGGNAFRFLMELERISFVEAIRKLAEQAGIALPESREVAPETQDAYDGLYAANELARKYYAHLLQNDPSGATARAYLEGRGLSQETMSSFSLGYAPNAWDGLLLVAGRRGIGADVLERAGLALPRRDGNGHYDRFRHRIVFPIQSHTGRTVAFGARALDPDEQAKYLNSPETPVYHKSGVLYGLWENRSAIRSEGVAIVVEGYMDLIALVQSGVQNVVASSGTALTPQHARLLHRFAQRAVLVFDGDAAGTEAAVRGVGALFEAGSETRVASLPEGHDPDSYVREHGRDRFQTLTDEAQPVLDFVLNWLTGREDLTSSDGRTRATEFIADFIARASDDARRQFLIQETAEKVRIDEATVVQVVQRIRRSNARRTGRLSVEDPVRVETFDPRPRWERELLLRMMAEDDVADVLLVQIRPEDFSNSAYRRVAGLIAQRRGEGQSAAVDRLIDGCEDAGLAQIISTLSMEVGISDPDTPQPPLQDYIGTFRIKSLDTRIDTLEAELKAASGGDVRELMEKHRELTEQRRELAQKRTTDHGP